LLSPPEGKKQIVVEQVRELCAELAMTSYSSGYKVAIVDPAERMNVSAANSLLKTLEEPTDNTLLILVRSRLDTLPATVASRCQRLRFAVPAEEDALRWLDQQEPGRDWRPLLRIAAGAPLAALQAAGEGVDELDQRFCEDLVEIAAGRRDPVKAASDWSKIDPRITLAWLNGFVVALIRRRALEMPDANDRLQNLSEVLPLEQLFMYLDEVQGSARRIDGALNLQMTLENLLIPWATGLQNL
jgi:DNA polymerase-3 subunit delta'